MRIAQVAPLFESVPPQNYGGTERVVHYLTEELVRLGHDVTLFASGDSRTSARLVATSPRSLRTDASCRDQLAHQIIQLERVCAEHARFDIIHFHIDYLHYPLSRRLRVRHVTTLHGRLDIPDLQPLYREYNDVPVISISNAQRTPLPDVNWQETVYHGLPPDLFHFHPEHDEYLLFLGRVSPEKGLDNAIAIAQRAGLLLKIAAKVDVVDREYFETVIRPKLGQPGIEWLGEAGGKQKEELLGRALAVLFAIEWPEPFGLVMIESMACGTPVIAYPHGSVPEVMANGISGFVVDSIDEAVAAVGRVASLDRARCRRYFEERFLAERMARDYLKVYERIIGVRHEAPALDVAAAAAGSSWTRSSS